MKFSKLLKTIIMIIGINSTLGAVNLTWVPIAVDGITMFVPYGQSNEFKTLKSVYKANELVSVQIDTELSGNKDWVGLYLKGADNSGGNVIAWNFVGQGTTELYRIRKDMPVGEYEVRLFFNNSYDVEATYTFSALGGTKKYPKTTTYYKRATDQNIPQPTVDNPSFDKEFGTKLSYLKQPDGEYYYAPDYPKIQAWNSDMSLVRLGNRLYDADTLKETAITNTLSNDKAYKKLGLRYGSSFRWSAKDPNKFYVINHLYPNIHQLVEVKIDGTKIKEEVLYDFTHNGYKNVDMSNGEGNIDFNDQYIALPVQKLNDNRIYIFLYDLQKKKPVWNEPKLYDNPNAIWKEVPDKYSPYDVFDWVTVSPSGKYIVINDNELGMIRYDINFRNKKKLQFRGYNGQLVSEAGHGDICYNTTGQEVFVSFVAKLGPKGLYSFDLDHPDEEGKRIINEFRAGGHVSCRNTIHKGWAYITTREEGHAETYAVKLDGTDNKTVQRFFQTHANNLNSLGASVSPDGTKVIFSNKWGTRIEEDIKSFIAQAQDRQTNELQTAKDVYKADELVSIQIDTELSGNKDWVGIYKVGDSNAWDNVIAWNWVSAGTHTLNKDRKSMPAGEYEVRLFFNNSYEVEKTYTFNVEESDVKDYATLGEYTPVRYPTVGLKDGFVVYRPENGITPNMPVVLFLEGGGSAPHVDDHKGIMKFMASQGYFVIGAESGESYDSNLATGIFENAINIAKEYHNLSVSKLAVMGHSQGGGQAFYVMKYFQDQDNGGYGSNASSVISIDGWFSFNMNQSDLKTLNSKVSFVQMNGLRGTGTDPRVKLSIWNLADVSEKSFFTLPHNNHSYSKGDLNNVLGKKDLLRIIGALTEDAFTGGTQGYNTIPLANKATYQDIYNALISKDLYSADCDGNAYNASSQVNQFDIDYCTPEVY